jgi:hypothetical protein
MTDYKVRWHGRLPGGFGYSNEINVTSNQTPSALVTTMASILTDFWNNGTYGVGAQYHTDTTLDTFDVYTLDGTFKATAKTSFALSLAGTSADNPLSDSTTLTIKKTSTSVKRNGRGYLKLPAPVEGTLVAGYYSSATRTRFQQAAEAILTGVGADGSTIFVHTGAAVTHGGVPAYTKTVITAMHASNKPGTNRARTRKQIGVYV